jgi:hypothetical protein
MVKRGRGLIDWLRRVGHYYGANDDGIDSYVKGQNKCANRVDVRLARFAAGRSKRRYAAGAASRRLIVRASRKTNNTETWKGA